MGKDRRESSGFTKFDNYFLDHIMRRVTGGEWKVVCAIIRETVGWHRKDAIISIDQFMEMTGVSREGVVAAIKRVCRRTVVRRTAQQRSFRYEAIPHANLKPVPKPDPRRHQQPLPFDSEFGKPTPSTSSENRLPSEFGNPTPSGPVLIFEKERSRSKDTHTEERGDESSGVCVANQIDGGRYRAYARAHPNLKDVTAWSTTAERTRQWDGDVLEWERQQLQEEPSKALGHGKKSDASCPRCFGQGMEIVSGEARRCNCGEVNQADGEGQPLARRAAAQS